MQIKNIARLKIDSWQDREKVITGIANSGYKVWVEEKKSTSYLTCNDFYVCIELTNDPTSSIGV